MASQSSHPEEEEEEEEYSAVSFKSTKTSAQSVLMGSVEHTPLLFPAGIKVNLRLHRSTDDQNGLSLYDAVTHDTPVGGGKSLVYSIWFRNPGKDEHAS